MLSLKEFVEQELKLDEDFYQARNKMLSDIWFRFDHYMETIQKGTYKYADCYEEAKLEIFKDKEFTESYRSSEIFSDALRVINACVLDGVQYESVKVPNVFDKERKALVACIPSIEYKGTYDEDYDEEQDMMWSNITVWQYNEDMSGDSDVVRYVNCLLDLRQKLINWLVQYYMEHPLKCAEGDYTLDTNSYDWAIFLNYAAHTLLRVVLGLYDDLSFKLSPRTAYERYAMRYVLQQFKDELGVQIFYDSTSDKRAADMYTNCFPDIKFSDILEENYTKSILNLTGKDNDFESVRGLEELEETYLISEEDLADFFKEPLNTKLFNTKL